MHVLYLCTYCVKCTKERGVASLLNFRSGAATVNQPLMRFKLAVDIFPRNNELSIPATRITLVARVVKCQCHRFTKVNHALHCELPANSKYTRSYAWLFWFFSQIYARWFNARRARGYDSKKGVGLLNPVLATQNVYVSLSMSALDIFLLPLNLEDYET